MSCIYVLQNKLNNKCYVGQTTNKINNRLSEHKYNGKNYPISNAINKYGLDGFKKYIYYLPVELLDLFEIELIKRFNTIIPNGYNLQPGGNKYKHHHRQTIEKYFKGDKNPMFGICGKKHPRWGMKHSEETKRKIAITRIGKPTIPKGTIFSEEHRKNISLACKGRIPSNKGKKQTEENKKKQSIKMKEYWKTHIHPNTGKQFSEELKKKISESKKGLRYNIGIPFSEERKKNISLALKKQFANGRLVWNKRLV